MAGEVVGIRLGGGVSGVVNARVAVSGDSSESGGSQRRDIAFQCAEAFVGT